MDWMTSHGITFLSGVFVGAAGKYLGDLFTDQRHRQEDARQARDLFNQVAASMPDLLREMRNDLLEAGHQHVREFFVIREHAQLMPGGKAFVYHHDDKNDYLAKTRILESHGYVVDITPANAPMFRMTESFVNCLKKWGM
jgi:hypothetical protein